MILQYSKWVTFSLLTSQFICVSWEILLIENFLYIITVEIKNVMTIVTACGKHKGKAIPLQAWTGL